jgi:FtsH-binding integral membrane protein
LWILAILIKATKLCIVIILGIFAMKYANVYSDSKAKSYDSGLRDYMCLMYRDMGLSLLIGGLAAFFVGSSRILLNIFFSSWLVATAVSLAPIFVVYSIGKNLHMLSVSELRGRLFIVACLMGISLSPVFVIYSGHSIAVTFLTAALTFGSMSLYGYTTKRDLMALNSFLMMGIFGLLSTSLVNLFLKSNRLDYTISIVGVIIFIVFAAFDVQKFKILYSRCADSSKEVAEKVAIIGALELYMDFVNLFMYLLRFLGEKKRQD